VTSVSDEIKQHLSLLIGLPLSIARRAADMLVLHFGTIREVESGIKVGKRAGEKGTVGDFSLHIQCPWRVGTRACGLVQLGQIPKKTGTMILQDQSLIRWALDIASKFSGKSIHNESAN